MLKSFTPLAFILLWIVPVGWVGLMRSNYPLYPDWIAPLFRVSGIFESAPSRWRIFFIEVQDRENRTWNNVDEKSLFASTPLGDRTRFQPLMNEMGDSKSSGQVPKLLEWIAGHLSQADQVKAVRIIHFSIPSETFLKCASLADVYKTANAMSMPREIDASLKVTP